jgi:flagellar biosynthesis/type III secretory pathway protein FliH
MSTPASSRHTRKPGFLTGARTNNIHPLFGSAHGDAEPELMFPDGADHDDEVGVESLAPPLPTPPAMMSQESSEKVATAIAELKKIGGRLGAEIGSTALEIGCLLARQIIDAELKTDPEVRVAMIKAAIRRLGESTKVTVRLAPVDRDTVASLAGEGELLGLPLASIELIADTNLSPGDAIVESDTGMVDGRLGTRLEELRRVLGPVMKPKDGES